jgi:8-oxo-dGTP pyrophosphatase MutT (NUDIX family)
VLLVQRTHAARFMGGVWVFPGGAVGSGDEGPAGAAVRELAEEAGIDALAPEDLVPFSRWITPEALRTRFDTWFYAALAPDGVEPEVDGEEVVALGWFTPAGALAAHAEDELALVFPTVKHLEQLTGFPSAEAILAEAHGRVVEPVLPRMVGDRVVLPGEPDYDRGTEG